MSLLIYETEKASLLAEILRWLPKPIPDETAGNSPNTVIIRFDDKEDEDIHNEGSAYGGLGDILEEKLRKLWEAYPGQVTGEVFVISFGEQQNIFRIKLGNRFSSEIF